MTVGNITVKEERDKQENVDYNFLQGRFMSTPQPGEEIVISGMAGMFPESNNIYHFQHNLFTKHSMITPNKRFRYKHPEIPNFSGTIPVVDKYDAGFFGVHMEQAHSQDSMSRNLLEKTIEALIDAGINPKDMEGSNTGVYGGTVFSEVEKYIFHDRQGPSPLLSMAGTFRTSYGYRIAYYLKLKGPNFVADTACSSSFFALENAFRDIRLGVVDTAIVLGAHLNFHPYITLQFARLGVLNMDGCCKVFDQKGDGYTRSEVICVMILQKKKVAKRNYSEVIYVKSNCDGFKNLGITYPSGEAQTLLLTECYADAGINPADLSYVEAHGTGTSVGDPEEAECIDKALAKCRKNNPLLVGSVKSNIGHSEPSSGIASIVKTVISLETGFIAPNLHFNTPRDVIRGIIEGRMEIVTEKRIFKDNRALIGVNNFGFGGGNCHVILKGNRKEKVNKGIPKDDIPRIICISGRTIDALTTIFDDLKSDSFDSERIGLFHNVYRKEFGNYPWKGFTILSKSGEISRHFKNVSNIKSRPLYFVFGELNQWCKIGNQLMPIFLFADTIEKIQNLVGLQDINFLDMLSGKYHIDDKYQVMGSVVVQIALLEMFRTLDIHPKQHYGCSFGQLVAAYSSGLVTLQQTIDCAFIINKVADRINDLYESEKTNNNNIPNNRSLNLNGVENKMNVFSNFRFSINTPEFLSIKKKLINDLSNILKKQQSTQAKNFGKDNNNLADYLVEALTKNYADSHFDRNSIVLTFGEVKKLEVDSEDDEVTNLDSAEDDNYMLSFLNILGDLYVSGHYPQLDKLYQKISFPVSRGTRMISPFIKWNHERSWYIPEFETALAKSAQSHATEIFVDVLDQKWSFIKGHVVDGRNLFPATGYLFLVWEIWTTTKRLAFNIPTIIFENVKYLRATNLPKKGSVKFIITINQFSGNFEIAEGNSTVVTGQIASKECEDAPDISVTEIERNPYSLKSKDIYKELRLRGYNYSGGFRAIEEFNGLNNTALIKWNDNWITFLDNMLQTKLIGTDTRLLYVPTYISQIVIPVKSFEMWVNKNFKKKDTEALLPVYVNEFTGQIRSGNVIIKGLIASSIPRKRDVRIPILETYQFVPNITDLNLDESIRVNMQIFLENALIKKVKCVELIDEYTAENSILIPYIQAALGDQPLVQAIPKILSKVQFEEQMDIPVEDRDLSAETDTNLIIGSKLLERPEVLKSAFRSLTHTGFVISREGFEFDLSGIDDFTVFTIHTTPIETIVLLRKNLNSTEVTAIDVSSTKNFSWIGPLKQIIKTKISDNVLLFSQNQPLSGVLGLVNCLRREPDSFFVRCLLLLDQAESFDKDQPFYKEQLNKNMAVNIWKNNTWGTYRHLPLKGSDHVESEHCFVNTTVRGDLSSLKWIESNLRGDIKIPQEKKIVCTHYVALNFRDIMTASGRINADVITQDRIEQECVQGFEFSGYTKEGKRVMGMVIRGAMSTLVLADEHLLFDIPDDISLQQAATIPTVYGTVIYGMLFRARLKQYDSVLIHSGTGGVGQAAIRLALHYKCNVFTTVGNSEKREYLLKTFPQLKPNQIGNSRDLTFEKMVRKYTHGRGVDIVLNSLAEEKLLASVRCLAPGGQFVEIGKFDMARNNELSLLLLKKEATFHGVMLDQIFFAPPEIKLKLVKVMRENIGKFIVPLPATCFGYNQIEEAFRYMSTGKHIGKVLLEIRTNDRSPPAPLEKFLGVPRYFCHEEKSYIIIGGLGGFGLELADWLVIRGVKKLVLTSRKGICTGYQNMRVKLWESYGVTVHISKDDICTETGCRNLLQETSRLGEVHAIFNLAVVLADAVFENQTIQNFETSFGPKAVATEYLDKLSRTICPNLKDFVIFSSVTCGRGNAGQTNYGMANSIMERICEKRKSEGYPALAIQWGAVGDVGLVAEMQTEHTELEIGGTLQQRILNCLNVLDIFLRQSDAAVVSSMVVAEKRTGPGSSTNIIEAVLNVLGLDKTKVSPNTTLPELGMDSMTGMEIKQMLERDFDIIIGPKDMKTMTLAGLKELHEKKTADAEETNALDMALLLNNIGDEESIKVIDVKLQSKLANDAAGPSVHLFPGLEGFANKYMTIAQQLMAHVVAYQYWNHPECMDVRELAESLLPNLEQHISENEAVNVVAYSYGSLVAIEIVRMLEAKGYNVNFIIIDGGIPLMKKLIQSFKGNSDNTTEIFFIYHLLSLAFPTEDFSKHQEKLLLSNTWEERLTVAKEIIGQTATPEKATYVHNIINGLYKKIKSVELYSPSFEVKLKAKINLYKPTTPTAKDIEEDHGLSQITESSIEIANFDGNHITILNNEELVKAINAWVLTPS